MLEGADASLHPRTQFPSISARKKRRFTAPAHGQHSHTRVAWFYSWPNFSELAVGKLAQVINSPSRHWLAKTYQNHDAGSGAWLVAWSRTLCAPERLCCFVHLHPPFLFVPGVLNFSNLESRQVWGDVGVSPHITPGERHVWVSVCVGGFTELWSRQEELSEEQRVEKEILHLFHCSNCHLDGLQRFAFLKAQHAAFKKIYWHEMEF